MCLLLFLLLFCEHFLFPFRLFLFSYPLSLICSLPCCFLLLPWCSLLAFEGRGHHPSHPIHPLLNFLFLALFSPLFFLLSFFFFSSLSRLHIPPPLLFYSPPHTHTRIPSFPSLLHLSFFSSSSLVFDHLPTFHIPPPVILFTPSPLVLPLHTLPLSPS